MLALRNTLLTLAVFGTVGLGAALPAAAQTVYKGSDPGVGPGRADPNSKAAAAAFTTGAGKLGATQTITFESAPLGYVSSTGLALDSNTTITTSNQAPFASGISNVQSEPAGYNTTAGGSQYFRFAQNFGTMGTVTFTFATPIDAFGSYLTGTERTVGEPIHLIFEDGSSQTVTVPKGPEGGGIQYFGITDPNKSVSSVTFSQATSADSRDIFGIDDVTYVKAPQVSSVPEPSPLAVMGLGVLALAGLALRRRHSKSARTA